mgnify:FL=1
MLLCLKIFCFYIEGRILAVIIVIISCSPFSMLHCTDGITIPMSSVSTLQKKSLFLDSYQVPPTAASKPTDLPYFAAVCPFMPILYQYCSQFLFILVSASI